MAEKQKTYFLDASQIKDIAPGHGGCIASDKITVEGRPVGFMYREAPRNDIDSGWCFFSGEESDAYMQDAGNFAIYDVNTIANYDPSIVPYLGSPIGSAFERPPDHADFIPVEDWESGEA